MAHVKHGTPTPYTHTGVLAEELTVEFGAAGGLKYTVNIPKGTLCWKLEGGTDPWVVGDHRLLKTSGASSITMPTITVFASQRTGSSISAR